MVRKKDSKDVFAMKVLKKESIEARNQRVHTEGTLLPARVTLLQPSGRSSRA